MNPLGWALATVLSALVFLVWQHAPFWIAGVIVAFAAVLLLAYVGAYLFFMLKNPDALRSERFTLSKMQIEKSQIGDTLHGFKSGDLTDHMPAMLPMPEEND
jgi:membrane protein implicated in regulation of membrane protease activity